MPVTRVCPGIQLLLILVCYVPRFVFRALEKTRLATSMYLISVVVWTDQENMPIDALLPGFPHHESFCGTRVSFVGLKTLPLFFFGRISVQMPTSATT